MQEEAGPAEETEAESRHLGFSHLAKQLRSLTAALLGSCVAAGKASLECGRRYIKKGYEEGQFQLTAQAATLCVRVYMCVNLALNVDTRCSPMAQGGLTNRKCPSTGWEGAREKNQCTESGV